MRAGKATGPQARPWNIAASRVGARARARRRSQFWRKEERTKSVGFAVACSLFLALIVTSLLVGGPGAVGLSLRSAVPARQPSANGDVVYTMPGGQYCRHLSFNNTTAEVTEGALERCPDNISISGRRPRGAANFAWGAH